MTLSLATSTNLIAKFDRAKSELMEAKSIFKIMDVRRTAEGIRQAGVVAKDSTLINQATELKVRAEQYAGKWLKELKESRQMRPGRPEKKGHDVRTVFLKEAGISKNQSSRWQALADVAEKDIDEYLNEKKTRKEPISYKELIQTVVRKARRKAKIKRITCQNQPMETSKRYNILLADPPWEYRNVISDSRRIENQYPTMPLDEIKRLPVNKLAANDAVLFLWATSPGLEEALSVLNAWGFTYRTSAVWVKPSIGPGHWFRIQHELLLVGARGEVPVPLPEARTSSVIEAQRGKHSEKPECVYSLIESAYPEFPRIELFARGKRQGWEAWGNEA